MRLLIVAECEHYNVGGEVFAPRHFVREIDLWASMFETVELLTRFPPSKPNNDVARYLSTNIAFIEGNGAFERSWQDRTRSILRSSRTMARMVGAFRRSDAVHIRCPSRNGLIALLLQCAFRKPCYVKWAGNWNPSTRDPRSSHIQRSLIRRCTNRTVATVYGRVRDDPDHVYETATASLSRREVEQALAVKRGDPPDGSPRLLWVGRFSANKNTLMLMDVLERVRGEYPGTTLHFAGDGPMRTATEMQASQRGLADSAVFHGALPWDRLAGLYASSRLLLLPSGSEGFPKVVHEAALFGTPSVVFSVGALPRIVRECGQAVSPPGEMASFARSVLDLLENRKEWERLSTSAKRWAGRICLESVVDDYRGLIERSWGVDLREPRVREQDRHTSTGG